MRVILKGKGPIKLDKNNFVAGGGEGDVYIVKGDAFKIYHSPSNMLPLGKIQELGELDKPYIVKPKEVVYDDQNKPTGYTMQAVPSPIAITKIFPPGFRKKNNIQPDDTLKLVLKLQEGISFIHSKKCLLVDINQFNFVLNETNYKDLYFIDVDTYQTRSFPATALADDVKDWISPPNKFTELTDWYSFAVLSFNLFTGIHPYKGNHPDYDINDPQAFIERMKKHVSVLNPKASFPKIVLPFTVIPKNYLNWYKDVLEGGKRLPPPSDVTENIVVIPTVTRVAGDSNFDIVELFEYTDPILFFKDDVVLTTKAVYISKQKVADVASKNVSIFKTPHLSHIIAATLKDGKIKLVDLSEKKELNYAVEADEISLIGETLYYKTGDTLNEMVFTELGNKVIPSSKLKLNILPFATQLFDGCVMQNIVNDYFFTFFVYDSTYQVRMKELKEYKVIDAKYSNQVLMVTCFKDNKYSKWIFRFDKNFTSYDIRTIDNISVNELNFTVMDNGIVIHMNEDEVELFHNTKDNSSIKVVQDNTVRGDVRLYSNGVKPMFVAGNKIYKFNMR